jgi:hypothetical protein
MNGRGPFTPENFLRNAADLPIVQFYQLENIDTVSHEIFRLRFSPHHHRSAAGGGVYVGKIDLIIANQMMQLQMVQGFSS